MAAKGVHSNVFVGNLTSETTEDRLRDIFATYGAVESCRVVSKDGKTNAFVKMVEIPGAEQAIGALNGQNGLLVKFANFDVGGKQKLFGGKQGYGKGKGWGKGWGGYGGYGAVWVPPPKLQNREDEPEKPEGPPSENLYVKHLPVGISEDDVKATFSKAGEVAEVRMLRPEFSLEWAALVRMGNADQGAAARQSVDGGFPAVTPGPLSVAVQQKGGEPKEDHAYIKGIPTNTSKAKLEALFGKYGEVKWCDTMPSAKSWKVESLSAALVQMGTPEECQKAIQALNEQVLPYNELGASVKVRFALIKDKKEDEAAAA